MGFHDVNAFTKTVDISIPRRTKGVLGGEHSSTRSSDAWLSPVRRHHRTLHRAWNSRAARSSSACNALVSGRGNASGIESAIARMSQARATRRILAMADD